jgi:hypothetical protein
MMVRGGEMLRIFALQPAVVQFSVLKVSAYDDLSDRAGVN